MRFSRRVAPRDLNPIARAEARASNLVNMSDSNPTRHGLGPRILGQPYDPDPRGDLAARKILAEFLSTTQGREVNPERLYLLSSTSQGYAWLMKLLADRGDRIAVPRPGYPLVEEIARLESIEVATYRQHWVGQWETPFHDLEGLLSEENSRVRGIAAINPNNPTGVFLRESERRKLIDISARHQLPIISDEVFFNFPLVDDSDLAHVERRRLSDTSEVLTFSLDGLSKSLAAPLVKFAWIEVSGPADDVHAAQERLDVIADAYLPMSSLVTERLTELLPQVPATASRIRQRARRNLDSLREICAACSSGAIQVMEPQGGWNALIRFPSFIDENEIVTSLISRGYTAQPGYFFDMPFAGVLSISLLLEPELFDSSSRVICKEIEEFINRS